MARILTRLDGKDPSTATALAAVPGAAPEQLVRLIHLVPLPQRP